MSTRDFSFVNRNTDEVLRKNLAGILFLVYPVMRLSPNIHSIPTYVGIEVTRFAYARSNVDLSIS